MRQWNRILAAIHRRAAAVYARGRDRPGREADCRAPRRARSMPPPIGPFGLFLLVGSAVPSKQLRARFRDDLQAAAGTAPGGGLHLRRCADHLLCRMYLPDDQPSDFGGWHETVPRPLALFSSRQAGFPFGADGAHPPVGGALFRKAAHRAPDPVWHPCRAAAVRWCGRSRSPHRITWLTCRDRAQGPGICSSLALHCFCGSAAVCLVRLAAAFQGKTPGGCGDCSWRRPALRRCADPGLCSRCPRAGSPYLRQRK